MPVPRRSTEPGRPRHRAPDTLVDFHTGDDAAARAYAAADVDAGAPPRVWAGVGAEACSPCRAPHAEAVDLGSPATSPRVEVDVTRMPEPDVETLEASMRALQAEIERRERRRGKRPSRPGARRIFGDVKNRVA